LVCRSLEKNGEKENWKIIGEEQTKNPSLYGECVLHNSLYMYYNIYILQNILLLIQKISLVIFHQNPYYNLYINLIFSKKNEIYLYNDKQY